MKSLVLILLLASCSHAQEWAKTAPAFAFGQTPQAQQTDPLKVKGVYLGQTVQDYLFSSQGKARYAKFDIKDCSKASKKRNLDGPSDRVAGPSDREICEQFTRAAAGEKITVRLSYTIPEETTFEHGVVTDFSEIVLPDMSDPLASPWDKVMYDLGKKIGEPHDTTPLVTQNGFGATFTYRSACWTLGEVGHPSYVCAREDRWDGLKIVLVRLSSRSPADRQRELANKPSVID